jgi:hypothetical protein
MHLLDLAAVYAVLGVITTVYLHRLQPVSASRRIGEHLMTALFWPFAIALTLGAQSPPTGSAYADPAQRALDEAFEAVKGSPLESLLPESAVTRLRQEIHRSRLRLEELAHVVQSQGLTVEHARKHLAELESKDASERSLGSARLQLDNALRLAELRRRDTQTLDELTELLSVLRSQLVLARYAGSAPAGIADVVTDVWARVEVLGISLEPSEDVVRA